MAELAALGVLGCGNMGGAVARGAIGSGLLPPKSVLVFDSETAAVRSLAALGATPVNSIGDLFTQADTLVLAVKPQVFRSQHAQIQAAVSGLADKTVISVMAGISSGSLRSLFPATFQVVRVMPNLGLSVGEGATAIETDGVSSGALSRAEKIFGASGKTVRVTESQMDAVTGLSGSGPMYLFEFVEALTLAGVKSGLARDTAYALALQTVKGALALLEGSPDAPSVWSSRVCSPGGTTVHALHVLEQGRFKATLINAVEAAVARSKTLSQG